MEDTNPTITQQLELTEQLISALQESEAKYHSLINDVLEKSTVGVFILDANFSVVWSNRAIERYFDLSRERIIGQDKRRLILDHVQHIFEEPDIFVEKVFATYNDNNYVEHFECHVLPNAKRQERWLEHWSQPIRSGFYAGGRVEYYYNITRRKLAEKRLSQAHNKLEQRVLERTTAHATANKRLVEEILERQQIEDKLRFQAQLLDSVRESIVATDLDGQVTYWSKGAKTLFGYHADEVLSKFISFVVEPAYENEQKERMCKVRETGSWSGQCRQKRKDGTTFWSEVAISLVMDEHGQPNGLVGMDRDITRRKQMIEALHQSEERYRTLFEHSPVALWEEDLSAVKIYLDQLHAEGIKDFSAYFERHPEAVAHCATLIKVIDVNQAALKLHDAEKKDELLGSLYKIFLRGPHIAFKQELIAIAAGKTTFEDKEQILRSQTLNGHKRYTTLKWSVVPGYEDTLSKVLVSIIDITERIRVEEELRLLQAITQEINEAADFTEALTIALQKVVGFIKWDFSEAWLPDSTEEFLVCSPAWHSYTERFTQFRRLSETFTFASNIGLPGRVWVSKKPEWLQDISTITGTDFTRAQAAQKAGFKAAFGVPIIIKEHVLAVMVFFTCQTRPMNKHLTTLASTVAAQLGGVLRRKQIEDEKTQLFQMVNQQREQLRALSQRLADTQEMERKQLAQELHDQVGQNLTALVFNLNTLQTQLAHIPEAAAVQARLADAMALVAQTGECIQDVMAHLRPPPLDDHGLVAALRWYGNQFSTRTGIAINVQGRRLTPRLNAPAEQALFRIIQEALTNVARHAYATQVTITMLATNDSARITVIDDGVGFETIDLMTMESRQSWGLITMTERAQAVGGCCRIESAPGQGTRIIVEVPR